jgi:hypothetical protein
LIPRTARTARESRRKIRPTQRRASSKWPRSAAFEGVAVPCCSSVGFYSLSKLCDSCESGLTAQRREWCAMAGPVQIRVLPKFRRSLTKMTFVFVDFCAYVSPAKTEQKSPSSLLLSASARTRQHTLARPKDYQSRVSLGPSAHTAGLSPRPRPSTLRGLVRSGIPAASGAALDSLGPGRIRHAVNLCDDV